MDVSDAFRTLTRPTSPLVHSLYSTLFLGTDRDNGKLLTFRRVARHPASQHVKLAFDLLVSRGSSVLRISPDKKYSGSS